MTGLYLFVNDDDLAIAIALAECHSWDLYLSRSVTLDEETRVKKR